MFVSSTQIQPTKSCLLYTSIGNFLDQMCCNNKCPLIIFKLIVALSLNVPDVIFDEPVLGLSLIHSYCRSLPSCTVKTMIWSAGFAWKIRTSIIPLCRRLIVRTTTVSYTHLIAVLKGVALEFVVYSFHSVLLTVPSSHG